MKHLTQHPKTVFLIDGLGAVLSATLLGLVLAPLHSDIGMPKETLILLSSIAFVFALYSLSCYAFAGKQAQRLLFPIIMANSGYSVFTLVSLYRYHQQLSDLGLTYFVGELAILFILVFVEYKTWQQQNPS